MRFPPAKGPVFPALLVLIRKDLSKVYVNEIYYQLVKLVAGEAASLAWKTWLSR